MLEMTTRPTQPAAEPLLRLSRCILRPYTASDAPSLAQAANNAKIARWMRNAFPHPYTRKDAETWIPIARTPSPMRDLAICSLDGTTIMGGIGLKADGDIKYRTMEVGYWLGEDFWGQSIATEAVMAFCEWAFAAFPKLLRIEAEVFEGNDASTHVLEKAGFDFEARHRQCIEKMGVVLDALIYCRFRPASAT
ncbi:gcn5-related n-acetyltransferase [Ophiostoma piceae UAMH 11346]|uniref:Gcn5-related n-acetyltransferase n=1 Tax=Ophiostoma piceae (strain UAMH 11346) TaxID=1262450 RepID=S3C1Y9_OPHP1|nr:gcn5-related n-acetyltransferase [Ophiostoma piceae UAMH 11346]